MRKRQLLENGCGTLGRCPDDLSPWGDSRGNMPLPSHHSCLFILVLPSAEANILQVLLSQMILFNLPYL